MLKIITIAAPMLRGNFSREINIDNVEAYSITKCIHHPSIQHIGDAAVFYRNCPAGSHHESKA